MMSNPTERLPFLPVARGTFWGSVITTVMGMPLGRYFAVIGSVLLALLFLADRYLPRRRTGRTSIEPSSAFNPTIDGPSGS